MRRAYSVNNLLNAKFDTIELLPPFKACIGDPELFGSWIVYGRPFNGKSTLVVALIKMFAELGGFCQTMQSAFERADMQEVSGKVILLSEPIPELLDRLRKRGAPKVVAIDSAQYTGLSYKEYTDMIDEFKPKGILFIIISHATKSYDPKGAIGEGCYFDAFVKIKVRGHRAFFESRYGGTQKYFDVWPDRAQEFYGELNE